MLRPEPPLAHWACAVDWTQPWLQPYRASGEPVAAQLRHGLALHDALNGNGSGCHITAAVAQAPVRFVAQCMLPPGASYEGHIADTGCCPTRDNLHDFFNGLVWMRWPQAKQQLSALQAGAIGSHRVGAQRGALRDALTLFDENGALLMAPRDMWDALCARDWKTLFVVHRARWAEARLLVFGHALLEKLVQPRKPITAHVYRVPHAFESIAEVDHWLARAMTADVWASKPFTPLPVLGVPGWWSGNEDDSFYDDVSVFRPKVHPQP